MTPDDALKKRKAWFVWYAERIDLKSVRADPAPGVLYRCPCCRCLTLEERGSFDICPVCYWEDDGQDDHDADLVRGGANGSLSLTAARSNYLVCGAADPRHVERVRAPLPADLDHEFLLNTDPKGD